jgi:DNA-binding transcriptional regulator GbsR (MarR family)
MELTPIAQRFIVHWGEMGTAWGVNRTVAQIHALLFFHGRPLHAEAICETLGVARSNVSNSLKELLNWNLIRTTQILGDRRDYFETSTDVWELFRTVVRERKEREFDPTVRMLRELVAQPDFAQETPDAQDRVRETLALMDSLGVWADEMLRLTPSTLDKVLRMGASVQRFVRGGSDAPKTADTTSAKADATVSSASQALPPEF